MKWLWCGYPIRPDFSFEFWRFKGRIVAPSTMTPKKLALS
ncbi:hypothetical protein GFS31_19450 [Leptolyngbya sp. BL0902]|nr:hypothetical protein GFS31_19450 [Leptolyngbya sp. BL0902]